MANFLDDLGADTRDKHVCRHAWEHTHVDICTGMYVCLHWVHIYVQTPVLTWMQTWM